MASQPQAANLLIITSEPNEAERLITSLRNGGLAVRGMFTSHGDRLEELVERRSCELIVCCAYDPEVDLHKVLAHHREIESDVPLVVIAERDSESQSMIQALRSGARDVTERDDTEHLQLVVGRELADLRQRRQARALSRRLQRCEQRSKELMESTGEAVAVIQQGMHLYANGAYLNQFRYGSFDDLQAAPLLDLVDGEKRKDVREFLRRREFVEQDGGGELDTICVRADSSRFHAQLYASRTEQDGEICLRLIVRDVDHHSGGTVTAGPGAISGGMEMPGYRALTAAIEQRIGANQTADPPFIVMAIRVHGVAAMLRNLGLIRGLGTVGSLADSLTEIVGQDVSIARTTDDGFVMVLDEIDDEAAEALAERIRSEVRLPTDSASTGSSEPDCEVGWVLAANRCPAATDLLDGAYRACLESGEATPGAGAKVKPTSLAARDKQEEEEGDIDQSRKVELALDGDKFILVYQPIVSLMGDSQENYSVLVRMLDEEENLMEAKEFIGPAIRSGLIEKIDRWAIRQAIQTMGEHRRAGHELNFFINLAEDTFRDPGVIVWICDCLREFDVRGSWLTFVFQEELVESNLGSLNRLAEGLKKIKCRVAINRFGATNRAQMLLQGLPMDFVLMLPDYASGLADDKDKQEQILKLANLAREYNVKSVVTGVEDARTLTILWTAGVDYVQGNFLQRPSPTLEVATA